MRDINRIPEIINELEKVWLQNPDFRLGQLITVATKPNTPHPTTFYIEDSKILNNLKSIASNKNNKNLTTPYSRKYPEICRIATKELTIKLISDMLNIIKEDKKNIVITPIKLMELTGAPISDENWLNGQKSRINKLKIILQKLSDNKLLEEVQIGYKIKE